MTVDSPLQRVLDGCGGHGFLGASEIEGDRPRTAGILGVSAAAHFPNYLPVEIGLDGGAGHHGVIGVYAGEVDGASPLRPGVVGVSTAVTAHSPPHYLPGESVLERPEKRIRLSDDDVSGDIDKRTAERSQCSGEVYSVVYKAGEAIEGIIKLWKDYESSQYDKNSKNSLRGPTLEIRIPAEHVTATNRQVRGCQLWGTDIYTDDSDIVAVLMHTGYCLPIVEHSPPVNEDLHVTIRILPPQRSYTSMLRNNVHSRAWGAGIGCSYRVEHCCVIKQGGREIDLKPRLTHTSAVEPALAPVAAEPALAPVAAEPVLAPVAAEPVLAPVAAAALIRRRGRNIPAPVTTWIQSGLCTQVRRAAMRMGYSSPVGIQSWVVPTVSRSRNCIILGDAGSEEEKRAKSMSYIFPLVDQLLLLYGQRGEGPTGLVLAPSNEDVMRIYKLIKRCTKHMWLTSLPMHNGCSGTLKPKYKRGTDILVCTPGRLCSIMSSRLKLSLERVTHLVIDGYDNMNESQVLNIKRATSYCQVVLISSVFTLEVEEFASALESPVLLIQ